MANEIYLYGDIGDDWWSSDPITDVSVVQSLRELNQTSNKHSVRINSPGGDASIGLAIMNVLRSHKAQMKAMNPDFVLECINDGYCMSAATLPFMVGDKRVMALGSLFMIHEAWSGCYGNAAEMMKASSQLDVLSGNVAQVYSSLCTPADAKADPRNTDFFRSLMKEESYFNGESAIACGLATENDLSITASLSADASTPEAWKGKYVAMMTEHYKKRTYNRASASKSITDAKMAQVRLQQMLATI